ncbi:sugar phosphate isomerase/epimerase [Pelagicoccus sp. SDUM812003]|uniref:sugar phosphate isomerase/epimerase family protein n=1 Tax=Pelagicoccus sp. SDUM812003 TaxID=3041267 RepID=UPI00280D190B|nr:sugar phosphate isomerase/epimerase [Pelagicoccus sp. SDUM812003]MDQ8202634.1 sugar phosphate isomerase/epimerase [Pelagicoccus sp. SDUM812003]
MKRIGARAHDFGTCSAQELAERLKKRGLCCAQLALNKAIAGLALKPGDLNPGLAWEVGEAFRANGVQIAVLGCYINPVNPDDAQRGELLRFFKDHLRFVGDMGGSLVGLETGTPNVDYAPDPNTGSEQTFQALVRSIAELVETAEAVGAKVAVEAVTHHTISTPERMKRLIDEIRSPAMVVIHDPVNLINAENYQDEARMIEEPFQLYGDRIAIIHAKDYSVEGGEYRQLATGLGQLDYGRLCGLIAKDKPGISVLLEDSGPDTIEGCLAHIDKFWPA